MSNHILSVEQRITAPYRNGKVEPQYGKKLNFKHDFGKYRTVDINTPEAAISYDEKFILSMYKKHSLKIKQPIHYGSWCGRSHFLSRQDIIIAVKKI